MCLILSTQLISIKVYVPKKAEFRIKMTRLKKVNSKLPDSLKKMDEILYSRGYEAEKTE